MSLHKDRFDSAALDYLKQMMKKELQVESRGELPGENLEELGNRVDETFFRSLHKFGIHPSDLAEAMVEANPTF